MMSLQNALAHRDLIWLAGVWQLAAVIIAGFVADREFWLIAFRVWLCFWLLMITYILLRPRSTPLERLIWSVGPILVFVPLAVWCVQWP